MATEEESSPPSARPQVPAFAGLPRWLVIGFVVKLALIVAITVAVLWWAGI